MRSPDRYLRVLAGAKDMGEKAKFILIDARKEKGPIRFVMGIRHWNIFL